MSKPFRSGPLDMGDARIHYGLADALEDEFVEAAVPVAGSPRAVYSDDPVSQRVYLIAHGFITSANDAARFHRYALDTIGLWPVASWSSMRPALESSIKAYWLLSPEDEVERQRRALRMTYDTIQQGERLEDVSPARTRPKEFVEKEREKLRAWAGERDLSNRKLKELPPMDSTKNEDMMDALPEDLRQRARWWWRLLSGIDHGDLMSAQVVTKSLKTVRVPGGVEMVLEPRDDRFRELVERTTELRMLAMQRFLHLTNG